jgi:hypothetical protein
MFQISEHGVQSCPTLVHTSINNGEQEENMTTPKVKKKKNKTEKARFRLFIVVGLLLGLVLAFVFLKKIYCLYAYQSIISGLIASLISILIKYIPERPYKQFIKGNENYIYAVSAALLMGTLVIAVSLVFRQYDKNSCVDDFDKLVGLIEQEDVAVINKDMNIIRDIYTTTAIVTNVKSNQSLQAYTFYSIKFTQEEHCTNEHGHYEVVSFTSREVTMTTSSQGTWGVAGQGCTQVFANPPGSDQWTFIKVANDWKIVNFEFNRSQQPP